MSTFKIEDGVVMPKVRRVKEIKYHTEKPSGQRKATTSVKTSITICSTGQSDRNKLKIPTVTGEPSVKDRYRDDPIRAMFTDRLTQEIVRYLFDYAPESGILTYRVNRGIAVAGNQAGTLNDEGYLKLALSIKGRRFHTSIHRLIWLWWYGYLPENEIDHVDHDKINNSLSNLREVSHSCNLRNSKMYSTNTSGVKGISYNKKEGRYIVRIEYEGYSGFIGYHDDLTEAVCHRYAAEQCLDFNDCDANSPAYQYLKREGILK